MKIAILGFGIEGQSLANFLRQDAAYKNAEIFILDKNPRIHMRIKNAEHRLGDDYLNNLTQFDVIFRSPGISRWLPELQRAEKNGTLITSATNLFFERFPGKIIGITGTKGKGTASTLLYKILKKYGMPAYLAGNIGNPMLDLLHGASSHNIAILELSSFQLWDIKKSPHVAVILDIFPDHLDLHKNLRDYTSAKLNIAQFQNKNDAVFYFTDSPLKQKISKIVRGKLYKINPEKFSLFAEKNLKILGRHNFKNAAIAASVAKFLGIPETTIKSIAENFGGLEHRLEFVRRIKTTDIYNDSAGTNPISLLAAVRAISSKYQNIILICGGTGKNLRYDCLKCLKNNSRLKKIFLIGENAKNLKSIFPKQSSRIKKNLYDAVKSAYRTALRRPKSAILFSPGSASFDMFKNYQDRGEQFKRAVNDL